MKVEQAPEGNKTTQKSRTNRWNPSGFTTGRAISSSTDKNISLEAADTTCLTEFLQIASPRVNEERQKREMDRGFGAMLGQFACSSWSHSSELARHKPLNSCRTPRDIASTPERTDMSYNSQRYYLSWFMPLSAATAEVNRNASLLADLPSKIFIPRFSLAEIGVAGSGGIHALCRRSSAAFSHASSHTSSAWTWPSQGRQESPIYLTAAATVKLLTCFYSHRRLVQRGNIPATSFWLKALFNTSRFTFDRWCFGDAPKSM